MPYLKEKGIDVRVLFLASNTKKLAVFNGLKAQGFACKLIPWELFWEEKIQMILQDLQDYPPDVFVPNYFVIASYAASWAKKAGIPSVLILHNDNEKHNHMIDVFGAGEEDLKVSAMVGVSAVITSRVKNKNTGNIYVSCIPCGAPVPSKWAKYEPGSTLKIIYAGRFDENQKRISDVVNAFCRVAREIPGTECVMYGSGDSLNDVLKILKEKGKGYPVKYGGLLDSSEVQEKLLQHHVFVLLSEYEGIPISLMEAMACGLVPVCSKIESGVAELINADTGIWVNDREDSFVDAIRLLKNDPGKWQYLSVNSRKKIIDEFSQEICNERWRQLLEKIAKQNTYAGGLRVPSIAELKRFEIAKEFSPFEKRMPPAYQLPFYRIRNWLSLIKLRLFSK